MVYKPSLLLKATVFLHHQTTCHPLFVRVDSSEEILENERSKRTAQCSRRFKECCFLPLFSFRCITDYKKFLKFLYDVATIGGKNVEKQTCQPFTIHIYGFPVSKTRKERRQMKRILYVITVFSQAPEGNVQPHFSSWRHHTSTIDRCGL